MTTATTLQQLKASIDTRINDLLCETKAGYDDSVVGINEAWDVVRKAFDEYIAREAEPLVLTIEAPVCSATMAKLRAALEAAPPGRLELLVESRKNSRTDHPFLDNALEYRGKSPPE